jgi:2-polyprenyl-3-methyl-5-hydroxy-6-metoxy-1,4-benzoquinol methylase
MPPSPDTVPAVSARPAPRAEMRSRCPICGSARVRPYCEKDGAAYHACRDCRVLFQAHAPDRDAMLGYADSEYDGGLYQEYVDAHAMKIAHFRARMAWMRPHLGLGSGAPGSGGAEPRRLLDVGCACGYFLEVAVDEGFEVQGLEFSPNAIAAARPDIRAKILNARVDSLDAHHDARYDVITAFDILEHLDKPLEFLAQARRLLRPGGHLVISTPDADHWLRPIMASRWPMLQPMQHLTLFSHRSLRLALERAGFSSIALDTAYKVISYEYLVNQLRTLNPWLFSVLRATTRLAPSGPMTRYRRVNIGEVMAIAARQD